jgi:hypothetical protein
MSEEKSLVEKSSMRELEPECSHAEHGMRKRMCASMLGIWFLSAVSVRGSADSLPNRENS